jgi:drug/metabolite transporter (DMT)-like permease
MSLGYALDLVMLYPRSRACAASVAAVRETSVVIATALAAPLLRERVGVLRLAGAVLVVLGVALLGA